MSVDISRLQDHLARWGQVEILTEIAHSNRASRTWLVAVEGARAVAKLTFDSPEYVEPGLLVAEYVEREARIHQVLMAGAPRVPGELLTWYRAFAMERHDPDAVVALDAVAEIETRQPLTYGVVYGDPSPELLMTPAGELALIDWGTPSWGPMMYDVATWIGHISTHSRAGGRDGAALLEEYVATAPWSRRETESLPHFATLWRELAAT